MKGEFFRTSKLVGKSKFHHIPWNKWQSQLLAIPDLVNVAYRMTIIVLRVDVLTLSKFTEGSWKSDFSENEPRKATSNLLSRITIQWLVSSLATW